MTQSIPVIGQRVKAVRYLPAGFFLGEVKGVSKNTFNVEWDGGISGDVRYPYQYSGVHTINQWNVDIFPDDEVIGDIVVGSVNVIPVPSHCSGCNNPNEWGAPANRGSKFVCGSCRSFGA